MNDLIRTDTIFGKRANIVGNISADLVLESLGKVYIKSRNKALTLEEIITSLALGDPNVSTSRVKVLESINSVDVSSYKSGEFLYDKSSKILYLTLDGDVIELISVSPDGQNYVRRTGDTMSGKLIINVKGGPALQVNTADLIKNLNAEYLNGEKATEFTRRNKDERIKGAWTFEKPTSFESETTFYKDIRAYGSIGSPSFSSGYGGYGWRMDATTNTLTVDNLVVRKLMQVYELVVNKISATNGSLWVTNAGKITQVRKLDVYDLSFFNTETNAYQEFLRTTHKGDYFVKLNAPIDFYDLGVDAFLDSLGTVNQVKNCLTPEVLYSARLIKVKTEGILELDFYNDDSDDYNIFLLFDLDFKFNTVFPIVTRNDYQSYKQAVENYDGTGTEPVANISYIYTYYKYFHSYVLDNLYLVSFDPEELPVFKTGDILRCQKWTYSGVKYYDAVVCNVLEMGYVIQVAPSVFDNNTSVVYNKSEEPTEVILEDSLNSTLYNSSKRHTTSGNERYSAKGIIGQVEEKDSLVLVGNLWDPQRLNAVYITSTDNGAPYIDTLSGMNRPDYSVIYYTPNFKKIKLYKTNGNTNAFVEYEGLVDVPYTGEYYIQDRVSGCDYIYFKDQNNNYYLTTNKSALPSGECTIIYYLSNTPNDKTLLGESTSFYILTEDEEPFQTELNEGLALEYKLLKLDVLSTKTTMARFGNLDGIRDEIFPIDKQPYGYGLYGQNVFLTGEFYLNNGRSLADISLEGLAFAMAAERALYQNINILRLDVEAALNLLRQSVYTKGDLRTAGMYIGVGADDKPGIVMWGNSILIATTERELYGLDIPTALFKDGKIKAKFLEVNEVHSILNYYNNPLIGNIPPEEDAIKIYLEDGFRYSWYYGAPQVYTYYPKVFVSQGSYIESDELIYIRMYTRLIPVGDLEYENDPYRHIWLRCDINGKHLEDNGNLIYVYYKDFSSSEYSPYDVLNIPLMDAIYDYVRSVDNSGGDSSLVDNTHKDEYILYQEFMDYITSTPLKLWSLHRNGRGNLGGNSVYWDTRGHLTVNGTITSLNGRIANFNISKYGLYTDKLTAEVNDQIITSLYNPIFISSLDSGGNYSNPSINLYSQRLDGNTYKLTSRTVIENGRIAISDGNLINNGKNFVSLSPDGLAWRKDGWDLGAAAVLFSLVFIPVIGSDGRYSAYIRCNGSGFTNRSWYELSGIGEALSKIIIYFDGNGDGDENLGGLGCIVFPRLDLFDCDLEGNITSISTEQVQKRVALANWIVNGLSTGLITPTIVSLDPCVDHSTPTFRDDDGQVLLEKLQDSNYRLTFLRDYRQLKATIENICFGSATNPWISEDQSSSDTNYDVGMLNFTYRYSVYTNSNGVTYFDNVRYATGSYRKSFYTRNYIAFSVSDDHTPNVGGFILTFLYNNFARVSWSATSSGNTPVNGEDTSISEAALVRRNTYNGYYTSMNNTLTTIYNYYTANSGNGYYTPNYLTARLYVDTYLSVLNNHLDVALWNSAAPSAVETAYTDANNALTVALSEYNNYVARDTHNLLYNSCLLEVNALKNIIANNELQGISTTDVDDALSTYRTAIDSTTSWLDNSTLNNDYTDLTTKIQALKDAVLAALTPSSESEGGTEGNGEGGNNGE